MSETILIIDDEATLRQFLQVSLSMHGYTVLQAETGEEGLRLAREAKPDAILLDHGLPGMNGVEIAQLIRAELWIPILFLSVRDDERTIVAALDAGADDFMVKPFRLAELRARLRAALRRTRQAPCEGVMRCGRLQVDPEARLVTVDGVRVALTPNEFALLQVLIKNQGRVVRREQLLQEVWGDSGLMDPHIVRVHVSNLRKKLEVFDTLAEYLTNQPGVGYRLAVPEMALRRSG
jgi:two-component system, OmpR family, KDP operon response regulator KdpE